MAGGIEIRNGDDGPVGTGKKARTTGPSPGARPARTLSPVSRSAEKAMRPPALTAGDAPGRPNSPGPSTSPDSITTCGSVPIGNRRIPPGTSEKTIDARTAPAPSTIGG